MVGPVEEAGANGVRLDNCDGVREHECACGRFDSDNAIYDIPDLEANGQSRVEITERLESEDEDMVVLTSGSRSGLRRRRPSLGKRDRTEAGAEGPARADQHNNNSGLPPAVGVNLRQCRQRLAVLRGNLAAERINYHYARQEHRYLAEAMQTNLDNLHRERCAKGPILGALHAQIMHDLESLFEIDRRGLLERLTTMNSAEERMREAEHRVMREEARFSTLLDGTEG